MSVLNLYYSSICPACRAILMLTKMLNVPVNTHKLNILTKSYEEEIGKMNPVCTLPVIQDESFTLWESHSIAPYLVGKYGKNDHFYPQDLQKRAIVDQILHFDSSYLYPTLYRALFPILFRNKFGISQVDRDNIIKCYDLLNKFLKKSSWLCGDFITIADFSCLATTSTLDLIYPVDKERFPFLYKMLRKSENLSFYELNLDGLDDLTKIVQERHAHYNAHKTQKS